MKRKNTFFTLISLMMMIAFLGCSSESEPNGQSAFVEDKTPPEVKIVNPKSGDMVNGKVNIIANVSDNEAIYNVFFYVNNNKVGSAPVELNSATFQWDTDNEPEGTYVIDVKAEDVAGNIGSDSISVSIDKSIPVVNITYPSAGQTVGGDVTFKAEITPVNGQPISKAEFFVDDQLIGQDFNNPFELKWDTKLVTDGNHTVLVKAIDIAQKIGKGNLSFVINNTSAPSNYDNNNPIENNDTRPVDSFIEITSPMGGEVSGVVTISVNASTDVYGVKFSAKLGDSLYELGYDRSIPFSFEWNTNTFDNGTYNLIVEGLDTSDFVLSRNDSINIFVKNESIVQGVYDALNFVEIPDFAERNIELNPGKLKMYVYVPEGMPKGVNRPIVLALHGCDANAFVVDNRNAAENYHTQSEWYKLADTYKFYVLYPRQQKEETDTVNGQDYITGNDFNCFDWGGVYVGGGGTEKPGLQEPQNAKDNWIRGKGENLSMINMIEYMKENYSINSNRIYVSGFSGGGAQAVLMAALWPDVFAGAAPVESIAYRCPSHINEVKPCLEIDNNRSMKRSADEWGNLIRDAFDYNGEYPDMFFWQASNDTFVHPGNLTELLKQWTNVMGIDDNSDESESLSCMNAGGCDVEKYKDSQGNVKIQSILYKSGFSAMLGHALPVDPGSGETKGGVEGEWTKDADIFSTYYIADFFGLLQEPDFEEPDVNIDNPDDPDITDNNTINENNTTNNSTNHVCQEWSEANTEHVSAGRAEVYQQFGLDYAKTVGNGDDLGLNNPYMLTTVKETAPGFFEKGSCD